MKNILFIQPYASLVGGVDTVLLQLVQGLVKELQIDLIHTHKMEVMGANFVGKWAGIPTVQTVHELARSPLFAYKIIAWLNHILNDRVIVLCERSKTMFRWFNQESTKLAKIYNRISVKPRQSLIKDNTYISLKDQLSLAPSDRILITVARLPPMKGLEYLIEAAALIRSSDKELKFVIVGDVAFENEKHYKDELLKKIEDLELQDTVFMIGLRRDVPELLEQSDILMLPSVYDIFPTVILEAMSLGLPVIATDVGGVPEMVRPETGLMVPPENSEALKERCLPSLDWIIKLWGSKRSGYFLKNLRKSSISIKRFWFTNRYLRGRGRFWLSMNNNIRSK